MNADRHERVFLVRLWREPSSAETGWRGSVADVGGNCKRYVTSPQEITEFVMLRLAASDAPDAKDRSLDR